jgi:Uma2 family endonuclease
MSTIARFSFAEYDRIVESGAFDQRRLELVRGEIREMVPIGPMHEEVVDVLLRWSARSVSENEVRLRIQQSVGLPELESAPEPDVAWVAPRSYARKRPQSADILLIIEVAESSLDYDRGDKAALYAEAGVADYWIVNLRDRAVEVHRDPHEGKYRSVTAHRDQDEVRPLAFPEIVLRPAVLWE